MLLLREPQPVQKRELEAETGDAEAPVERRPEAVPPPEEPAAERGPQPDAGTAARYQQPAPRRVSATRRRHPTWQLRLPAAASWLRALSAGPPWLPRAPPAARLPLRPPAAGLLRRPSARLSSASLCALFASSQQRRRSISARPLHQGEQRRRRDCNRAPSSAPGCVEDCAEGGESPGQEHLCGAYGPHPPGRGECQAAG